MCHKNKMISTLSSELGFISHFYTFELSNGVKFWLVCLARQCRKGRGAN